MLRSGIPGARHAQSQKRKHLVSTEDNKALVRRGLEEVWNQKNLAMADELIAPDYFSHFPLAFSKEMI
jgi:hypothetical protein